MQCTINSLFRLKQLTLFVIGFGFVDQVLCFSFFVCYRFFVAEWGAGRNGFAFLLVKFLHILLFVQTLLDFFLVSFVVEQEQAFEYFLAGGTADCKPYPVVLGQIIDFVKIVRKFNGFAPLFGIDMSAVSLFAKMHYPFILLVLRFIFA